VIADVPLGDVLVWIGALCNLVFPIPMIMATGRGQQRPSRVSFFMWTTQACIAFTASAAAGADIGALLVTGAAAAVLAAVFIATFVPQLQGRRLAADPAPRWQAGVDRLCLAVCVAALIGWWLTANPLVALLLAILTDAVAAVPTFVRGWRGEEDWLPYAGFAINAACSFVVITDWAVTQWAFIYYQLVVSTLLTLVPLLRNKPAIRPDSRSRSLPRWGARAATSAAAAIILASTAVIANVVIAPAEATPASALEQAAATSSLDRAAGPSGSQRPAAVPAAAIPNVAAVVPVLPAPGDIEVSPDNRSVLITHHLSMAVSVLDTQTAGVTATIAVPQGPPRSVAFCPTADDRAAGRNGDRAYISISDDSADDAADAPTNGAGGGDPVLRPARHLIGVLDTASNEVVGAIPVNSRPHAATCSPDGRQLWVPRPDDGQIDVFDTASNLLVASIPLPQGGPHELVFSPDGRVLYAACRDCGAVAVLEPATATVVGTIDVGVSPLSIALSPDGQRLAALDHTASEVSIIDTIAQVEVKRLATGENPRDVVWSADGRLLYSADLEGRVNGNPIGTLSAINVQTDVHTRLPTGDLRTTNGPTSITLDAAGGTAYLTNTAGGSVAVYRLGQ
jgi:YVTN family beta-propeller protein